MKSVISSALFFAMLLALSGCGGSSDAPPLATVEGTVKFDGQPLAGAMVVFTPKDGGAPSAGRTDESGHYELTFSRTEKGAKVGEHTVSITTYQSATDDEKAVPEKIPTKYNTKSELTKTVEDKANVIDFELDAGGEVVQPPKDS